MRFVLVFALLVACGDETGGNLPMPDALVPVHVAGCDDPVVWTAAALERSLRAEARGEACFPAQFPMQHTLLVWSSPYEEGDTFDRTCWRVLEAVPNSGWIAGQRFESIGDRDGELVITGFSQPVTVEGRVLLRDGTLKYALGPDTAKTQAARIVEPTATGLQFVIDHQTWAERNALHLWGQTIATDEVLAATASESEHGYIYTVHRSGAGIVMRAWWRDAQAQIMSSELGLGAGTRVRLAQFGGAVVIDNELVIIEHINLGPMLAERHRIALGGEPIGIIGASGSVVLHMAGALVRYDYFQPTPVPATIAVGDGRLVPARPYQAPYFFDGTTFHALKDTGPLGFDPALSFTPRADDLASLGVPVAAPYRVVFGENGLLAALDATDPLPGPRFASYAELYGAGTLGPIGSRLTTYAIVRDDGTAAIYDAPYVPFCP